MPKRGGSLQHSQDADAENKDGLPLGLQQLRAVWSSMCPSQRLSAITFDGAVRAVAMVCCRAVKDLAATSKQALELGFGPTVNESMRDLVLAPALEFIPEPNGQPDRPLGMMFAHSLVERADLWDVLEHASPGWGMSTPLPRARWICILKPMPSSWTQMETALAALLEQRLLEMMSAIYERAHQLQILEAEKSFERLSKRANRRAARNDRKRIAKQKEQPCLQPLQEGPVAGDPELVETDSDASVQDEKAAAGGTTAHDLVFERSTVGDDFLPESNCSERSVQQGCDLQDPAPCSMPNVAEASHVDGGWRTVESRRIRTCDGASRKPTPQNTCVDQLPVGSREHITASETPHERDVPSHVSDVDPPLPNNTPLMSDNPTTLPDLFLADRCTANMNLGRIALGWRAAASALQEKQGAEYLESRRKENASWRLWFMEQENKFRNTDNMEPYEPVCHTCANGFGLGRVCTCVADVKCQKIQSGPPSSPGSSTEPDQLLSECFMLPPCPEEPDEGDSPTVSWRQLLRGRPPPKNAWAVRSSGAEASCRRHENLAWRQWWAAHQAEGNDPLGGFAYQLFPPTPTSTFPGTPTATLPGTPRGGRNDAPEFFNQSAVASYFTTQVVYWPVPVRILPQVRNFIDDLLAQESSGQQTKK